MPVFLTSFSVFLDKEIPNRPNRWKIFRIHQHTPNLEKCHKVVFHRLFLCVLSIICVYDHHFYCIKTFPDSSFFLVVVLPSFEDSTMINLFTLKSDQQLISPDDITPESQFKVRRIKEMVTTN